MVNAATQASANIPSDDCALINKFLHLGSTKLTKKKETHSWTFGYFHTNDSSYYCSKYGSFNAGTRSGESMDLLGSTGRVVCPCVQGKSLEISLIDLTPFYR